MSDNNIIEFKQKPKKEVKKEQEKKLGAKVFTKNGKVIMEVEGMSVTMRPRMAFELAMLLLNAIRIILDTTKKGEF